MNKDQSARWKALHGNKQGGLMRGFYTVVLWLVVVISFFNGILTSGSATSAIHQIYGGVSLIIATLAFCTLAMRSKMSEEAEYIATATIKLKEALQKDKDE